MGYPKSVINFYVSLDIFVGNCIVYKIGEEIQNSIDQIGSYMRPRPSYI